MAAVDVRGAAGTGERGIQGVWGDRGEAVEPFWNRRGLGGGSGMGTRRERSGEREGER